MKKRMNARQLAQGLVVLCATCVPTACVDDSYDMSKDIDTTMAIGSDGLQLKLGSTEKIMLGDLLEVDKEEMFGEDASKLFYLTMKESTDFRFNVRPVTVKINEATLSPEVEVINLNEMGLDRLPVPTGETKVFSNLHAYDKFNLDISGIEEEVERIKSITPEARTSHFNLKLEVVQQGSDFRFKKVENLKIVFPEFVRCTKSAGAKYNLTVDESTGKTTLSFPAGSVQASNSTTIDLGTVDLQRVQLGNEKDATDMGLPIEIENGERVLNYEDDIDMYGDFQLMSGSAATMRADRNDFTDIRLTVTLAGNPAVNGKIPVELDRVEGVFCPEIDEPEIDPITLGDDLPDFLRDNEVKINVANPTLKFNVDMREIPMSLQFIGRFQGVGYTDGTARPAVNVRDNGGFVTLDKEREAYLYFYDHGTPYDPEGLPASRHDIAIDGLAEMVSVLPERIDVTIDPVQVKRNELCTIRLGDTYNAHIDYDILFPFEVNAGMKIVYNDSITGLHEDMQDYEADGIIITADMANTIPLELDARIIPCDYDGKEMKDVTVETQKIAPGSHPTEEVTSVAFKLTFKNRADLRKLDVLRFKVEAAAVSNGTSRFTSEQYLQVRNLRMKLAGQIVGDFN